jgi:hypothetical protein
MSRDSRLLAPLLWLGAYLAVVASGQAFSVEYLDFGWQLVPWDVLVHNPISSVWHLHTQPPLWNLALGLLARVSPFSDAITLQLFMVVLGMLLAWVVVGIVRALGVRPWLAVALTLVVTLNPEVLLNAFAPTYEMATALLLALAVRTAQLTIASRQGRHLVWFSCSLTALVLTRSLYHPALVVMLLGAMAVYLRRDLIARTIAPRAAAVALAVPLLLVGGWLLKNQVMFGDATTSSWLGMNLQRSTIPILGRADLEQMYADGEISEIAMIGPFANYGAYRDAMPPCTPAHDDPALTVEGHLDAQGVLIPNFNFECYLPVYEQAAKDFWAVATAHPGVWLEGRVFSLRMTFATSPVAAASPSRPLRALDKAYRLLRIDATLSGSTVDWGSPLYGKFIFDFRFSLLVLALYTLVALRAPFLVLRAVRRRRGRSATADDPVLSGTVCLVGFLGVFTVLVGAIGELGEQARFRSTADPIVTTIGLIVLAQLLRSWLGAPRPPAAAADQPAAAIASA